MPKRCKSDARYAISIGWSTRTLKRNDSRRGDVGVGAAEVEEEEVQASADRVHVKKRMHAPIPIPRTLPTPQKAALRGSSSDEVDGGAKPEVPQVVRCSGRAHPDRPWAARLAAIDEDP
jgi:hypothetical protein